MVGSVEMLVECTKMVVIDCRTFLGAKHAGRNEVCGQKVKNLPKNAEGVFVWSKT